jgi:hypothetical protein
MNKITFLLLFCLNFIYCHDLSSTESDTYEEIDSENYIHYNNVIESLIKYKNISSPCLKQVQQFLVDLGLDKEWTYEVIDSFGKPTSGLINGFFFLFKIQILFQYFIKLNFSFILIKKKTKLRIQILAW